MLPGNHALSAEKDRPEQAGGALGRYLSAQRLLQAAQHHVGQHLADRMACRYGGGAQRIENAAFRRRNAHHAQGAGIVRHVVADHTAHPEGGISLGIGQRHVDAMAADRGCALEIDVNTIFTDGYRADQVYRFVVAIDPHFVGPPTEGQISRCPPALLFVNSR